MDRMKKVLSLFLASWIAIGACPGGVAFAAAQTNSSTPSPTPASTPSTSSPPSPQELQQLVAPIALYPDSLVAQVLAASTYPAEIVEADRWLQKNKKLQGKKLADEVNKQKWDPSIKALTEFPSVLSDMDKNLAWTSSLGSAYIDDQAGVMNAVQEARQNAQKAGHLKSTSQQTVTQNGSTIEIQPANPSVVYVPEYNPWIAYGAPIAPWPGWYSYPGLYWSAPAIGFGIGFGIGFFGGFAWGWHGWGADWGRRAIVFNHNTYISHSNTFVHRGYYANRAHGGAVHNAGAHGGFHGSDAHAAAGVHHSAFSGYNHGGVSRGFSARGGHSMGGGHGGGGHGGR